MLAIVAAVGAVAAVPHNNADVAVHVVPVAKA